MLHIPSGLRRSGPTLLNTETFGTSHSSCSVQSGLSVAMTNGLRSREQGKEAEGGEGADGFLPRPFLPSSRELATWLYRSMTGGSASGSGDVAVRAKSSAA
jgi:hypothetical protein